MRSRRLIRGLALVFVALLAASGAAWAQGGVVLGGGGDDPEDCDPTNPDTDCDRVDAGGTEDLNSGGGTPGWIGGLVSVPYQDVGGVDDDIDDLVQRLAAGFPANWGGTPDSSLPGILFNASVSQICARETSAEIPTIGVFFDNLLPDMNARIRKIDKQPAGGGAIHIHLNDQPRITIATTNVITGLPRTVAQMNSLIASSIAAAYFDVTVLDDYIVVTRSHHLFDGPELHRVTFRSTDANIDAGEVSLDRNESLNDSHCPPEE